MGFQVGIAEFLEQVAQLKGNKEKIAALKFNDSVPLRTILQGAFDPGVEWLLPPGDPPYTPNKLVDQQGVLIRETRKLQYFIKGFFPGLKQVRREAMWVELLENVDPKDAALLCAIKEKKLPWASITVHHVREALPGLLPKSLKRDEQETAAQ